MANHGEPHARPPAILDPTWTSPYFDEAGQPIFADAFVLFMDLLGTRHHRPNRQAATEYLRTVRDSVQRAKEWSLLRGTESPGQGSMQWFSDNLAMAQLADETGRNTLRLAFLIIQAAYLQLAFLSHGLFTRGAIALDWYFADRDFIHGPALERAVTLEHRRASFPRVVLDEASLAVASDGLLLEARDSPGSPWRRHLAVSHDRQVFIDYLRVLLDNPAGGDLDPRTHILNHKRYVEKNLRLYDGIDGVEEKYRWCAGYHNSVVDASEKQLGSGFEGLRVRCGRSIGGFEEFAGS